MMLFRLHFDDGAVWDVEAASPDDARAKAKQWIEQHGRVVKCKVLKGS